MVQRIVNRPRSLATSALEYLEDRCLLSAAHQTVQNTILFSQAPAAVQTGLNALATTDGLTLPTASQTVFLGNRAGIEIYTVDIAANGINSALAVNVDGKPYTAPTSSTTTFGAVTNPAVTTELTSIATALNLTSPTSTDTVTVTTNSDGTLTFSFNFANASGHGHQSYSVDASGNPVGNASLPLSVFSSAISTSLTSNAPVGATPLTSTSKVTVKTANGLTSYSATYHVTGVSTTITVNNAGTLTNLPSTAVVQFSTIPSAAQTELQTLATADGYTGTISATQNVNAYDEANGTVIYTIKLPVTKTGSSGGTFTFSIRISADQVGNPTVPPANNGRGGGDFNGTTYYAGPSSDGFFPAVQNTILFSQAPAAVQTGLNALATTDGLTLPTASQAVFLGNTAGIEIYTVDLSGNGTNSILTVNVNGKPDTAPTSSTTTFGAVTNTAVTSELNAIAAALNLTSPASTNTVTVTTNSDGSLTFSFNFANASGHGHQSFSVDASGNPVGNASLPLSVFSSAISTGLTTNTPVGAAALTSSSIVTVKAANVLTTYSATYHATGITTTITVNSAGILTNLPSTAVVQFSTIPSAAQTELQTLATADGYTGTISATQNVNAYDEANGTVIYTVKLPVNKTGSSGGTFTFSIRISADQVGNPTVPPGNNGRSGGGDCDGDFNGPANYAGPSSAGFFANAFAFNFRH